jgi:hypothetical protein
MGISQKDVNMIESIGRKLLRQIFGRLQAKVGKDHCKQRGNCKVHDAVAMSTLCLKRLQQAGRITRMDDSSICSKDDEEEEGL